MSAKYNETLEEVKSWSKFFIEKLITDLLKSDKLDFVEASNLYVNDLERRNTELKRTIMPLALNLAMALKGNLQKEQAEELLYECQYFKGAPYHDELKKQLKK